MTKEFYPFDTNEHTKVRILRFHAPAYEQCEEDEPLDEVEIYIPLVCTKKLPMPVKKYELSSNNRMVDDAIVYNTMGVSAKSCVQAVIQDGIIISNKAFVSSNEGMALLVEAIFEVNGYNKIDSFEGSDLTMWEFIENGALSATKSALSFGEWQKKFVE